LHNTTQSILTTLGSPSSSHYGNDCLGSHCRHLEQFSIHASASLHWGSLADGERLPSPARYCARLHDRVRYRLRARLWPTDCGLFMHFQFVHISQCLICKTLLSRQNRCLCSSKDACTILASWSVRWGWSSIHPSSDRHEMLVWCFFFSENRVAVSDVAS
jgi:hypothetical protein